MQTAIETVALLFIGACGLLIAAIAVLVVFMVAEMRKEKK